MSHRKIEKCPNCGHDPYGDPDEFSSGGGWIADHSIVGGATGSVWIDELRCPRCREVVAREEQKLASGREDTL